MTLRSPLRGIDWMPPRLAATVTPQRVQKACVYVAACNCTRNTHGPVIFNTNTLLHGLFDDTELKLAMRRGTLTGNQLRIQ